MRDRDAYARAVVEAIGELDLRAELERVAQIEAAPLVVIAGREARRKYDPAAEEHVDANAGEGVDGAVIPPKGLKIKSFLSERYSRRNSAAGSFWRFQSK